VISILVGIAVDEGRLRVDQTLQELLPQQASSMTPQQASMTLRRLLTMTAGIPGDDGGLNLTADDTVSQILSYGGNDPGVGSEYSNSGAPRQPTQDLRLADHPIQCLCPESGQSAGIVGIDDQGTDTQSHGITVGNATAVVDRLAGPIMRIRVAVSCRV
jgi:hypothetical protein